MKRIITLAFILCLTSQVFSQTDGLTYQAVIINPSATDLPGVDSSGNFLPSTSIAIRFSIINGDNDQNPAEFQEIVFTDTDEFGRVNVVIGKDNDAFRTINWDGETKLLKVEIDFEAGSDFSLISVEELTFLPYASHRDITASGTLTVDGNTFLNGELQVENPTNLNSSLDVNNGNATNLTGTLNVDGETSINNSLSVTGNNPTDLSGDLQVGGNSNLDGTLDVLGATSLGSTLVVADVTNLGSTLDVVGATSLQSTLDVLGDTTLENLTVNGEAGFGDLTATDLTVTESTSLNGSVDIDSNQQVRIASTLADQDFQGFTNDDKNINSYPLLVEGADQGIAIKINGTDTTNKNNFISFWDDTPPSTALREPAYNGGDISDGIVGLFNEIGIDFFEVPTTDDVPAGNTTSYETVASYTGAPMMWGRIEGETDESEFVNNADYNMDLLALKYDQVDATLDLVWQTVDVVVAGIELVSSSADVRPCVGFGACVVSPGPSPIAGDIAILALEVLKELAAIANEAFAFRNLDVYNYHKQRFKGVSYASGAGDYAEYLLRENLNEAMSYGDIVSANGGKISKNTDNNQRKMVISYKPAVLGALPQPHLEKNYEKVAFMGQVPVKVYGLVNIGDYIVPSGNNDGFGKAISPNQITSSDIKNIVGVAWEAVKSKPGFNYVNVAVGLNANDTSHFIEKLENQISQQQNEIDELKNVLEKTLSRITAIENGNTVPADSDIANSGVSSDGRNYNIEDDIIYYEITDADVENGLLLAEKSMQDEGVDTKKHFVWKKLREDAAFKSKLKDALKKKLDKQLHYHKEVMNQSKN
ncbi:hypothetical protein BTO05_04950 [Winogradskyella sp. PC-19]|uniref:hypothetical protein n=1 Tax=unclassified Winogradskyella TaxID=2615021 RepID=UPI000B3C7898|nr:MULTISPECIES: hypothetical protein [unclassified Winogradskyella]ARV09013.1 hypothetical protein BTO05_04950 [Winogradskyella sp. PC-19]